MRSLLTELRGRRVFSLRADNDTLNTLTGGQARSEWEKNYCHPSDVAVKALAHR